MTNEEAVKIHEDKHSMLNRLKKLLKNVMPSYNKSELDALKQAHESIDSIKVWTVDERNAQLLALVNIMKLQILIKDRD